MQPELKGVSPIRSSQSFLQDQPRSSNHGLHHPNTDGLGSSHPYREDGLDEDLSAQRPNFGLNTSASSSSSADSARREYSPSSLSSRSSARSGSPVDRIIEHEQATAKSSKKKKESTSFVILPRKGGPPGTPLTNFPNGPYDAVGITGEALTVH